MRRNSDAVCLDLPYPISANRYWRSYLPRGHSRTVVVLSDEAKRYKEGVLSIARSMGLTKPMPGRVRVAIHLYPARPKDWKIRSLKQPDSWDDSVRSIDLDNALKVTLDALKGVAFGDDKWVWELSAKRMEPDGDARMVVVVSRIQIVPPVIQSA